MDLGIAEPRWKDGVFLGIEIDSGEKVISTQDGMIKVRALRRPFEAETWVAGQHDALSCLPWKPYSDTDDDTIPMRSPVASAVAHPSETARQVHRDEERVPRSLTIQKRDPVLYGSPPWRPGCYAAAIDRKYTPHTAECREIIEKAMLEDEEGTNKVKEAKAR